MQTECRVSTCYRERVVEVCDSNGFEAPTGPCILTPHPASTPPPTSRPQLHPHVIYNITKIDHPICFSRAKLFLQCYPARTPKKGQSISPSYTPLHLTPTKQAKIGTNVVPFSWRKLVTLGLVSMRKLRAVDSGLRPSPLTRLSLLSPSFGERLRLIYCLYPSYIQSLQSVQILSSSNLAEPETPPQKKS
jgi:hypothetical protein